MIFKNTRYENAQKFVPPIIVEAKEIITWRCSKKYMAVTQKTT
jgi:hypothetical protein